MIKGRDLKNLPAIEVSNGLCWGHVKEFKLKNDHMLAGVFITDDKQVEYYISMDKIVRIGRDAVIFNGPPEQPKDEEYLCQSEFEITGALVMTINGENIGTVQDIVLEDTGSGVVGYEVSDGYIKDILMGRKILDPAEILSYGSEAVIVCDTYPD